VAGRELACNFQERQEDFCLWELPLSTSAETLLVSPGLKALLLPPGDAWTTLFRNSPPQWHRPSPFSASKERQNAGCWVSPNLEDFSPSEDGCPLLTPAACWSPFFLQKLFSLGFNYPSQTLPGTDACCLPCAFGGEGSQTATAAFTPRLQHL